MTTETQHADSSSVRDDRPCTFHKMTMSTCPEYLDVIQGEEVRYQVEPRRVRAAPAG